MVTSHEVPHHHTPRLEAAYAHCKRLPGEQLHPMSIDFLDKQVVACQRWQLTLIAVFKSRSTINTCCLLLLLAAGPASKPPVAATCADEAVLRW